MILGTALAWSDWSILNDFIVNYYLGSQVAFSVTILLLVLGVLIANNIPFKFAVVGITPLVAGFAVGGWMVEYTWALNLSLLVLGLIYAFTLSKILS